MIPSELRHGSTPLISFVVPVFDEAGAVEIFVDEVAKHIKAIHVRYELIFVNDGSQDGTLETLKNLRDRNRRVKIVNFSRNFGKEAAMTAGLDYAKGDAVIIMDVDLQDPPEIVPLLIERWRNGFDVVNARRQSRAVDTVFKQKTAQQFYRMFNRMSEAKIPADVGDFRLLDRRVVEALKTLPERVRFMKGLFAWVGFPTTTVDYNRRARQVGTSKFNYWRLWNFALDGITSFSTVPLRMWTYLGLLVAALSFTYGSFIMIRTIFLGIDLPGYASTLTAVLFLGGIQLIGLGIMGEYLGRVYTEVKRRPAYIAASVFDDDNENSEHPKIPPVKF